MAKKETIVSKIEEKIVKEEQIIKGEIKKEKKGLAWFFKSQTFRLILIILIFGALIGGVFYFTNSSKRVFIENSEVSAPIIILSSTNPGILEKVFVKDGDIISPDTIVAQVNGVPVKSKTRGIVTFVQNTPGQAVVSQTAIVKMIDPNELRIVGHIQENKGLKDIKPGQKVIFTVDAFGNNQYFGFVDSISPASRQSDIVFSISDKRQEKEFDVNVKYDVSLYPELKPGMSARMWVYK